MTAPGECDLPDVCPACRKPWAGPWHVGRKLPGGGPHGGDCYQAICPACAELRRLAAEPRDHLALPSAEEG